MSGFDPWLWLQMAVVCRRSGDGVGTVAEECKAGNNNKWVDIITSDGGMDVCVYRWW